MHPRSDYLKQNINVFSHPRVRCRGRPCCRVLGQPGFRRHPFPTRFPRSVTRQDKACIASFRPESAPVHLWLPNLASNLNLRVYTPSGFNSKFNLAQKRVRNCSLDFTSSKPVQVAGPARWAYATMYGAAAEPGECGIRRQSPLCFANRRLQQVPGVIETSLGTRPGIS